MTDEERQALIWTIAMLRPKVGSQDRGETIMVRTANILQGLLNKLEGKS